jgi:eukaryotic-like serine/threonine-protein kinase
MLGAHAGKSKGLREGDSEDNVYCVSLPTTPNADPQISAFAAALAGQYELDCEIGRGGMGVVYRGRDVRLDRTIAIKTLPPHLANDPVVRERFLREARTAGSLSHPHIVPIHRADELGGHVFFVMGYVPGQSLAQRIRDQGRIDPYELVGQLADVADALGYAHGRGIIHRDVKAENILLDSATGVAMVTDFGIARLAEAAPLTATGQMLGTVYYLSPEQVSGDAVDGRSDIYSLGVVGFLALAGRFPFDAELASAVLIAHVTRPAPRLVEIAPWVPPELARIIDRCLAKSPIDRFASCAELRDALRRLTLSPSPVAVSSPASVSADARLVSDTEAQSIWKRAAELQALTGVQPRPAVIPASRNAERDAARTSGFGVQDVRSAAAAAGISTPYVEHALAEHGLDQRSSMRPSSSVVVRDRSKPWNELAGGRTHVEFEVVVDGEVPFDDYDLLFDIIRRQLGEIGVVGSIGKSFTWHLGSGRNRRNLQVSVIPRGGKTTIRVSERLNGVAGALFGGIMGAYGMGTSGIWIGLAAGAHQPILATLFWAGNMMLSYVVARGIFEYKSKKSYALVKALAEEMGEQAHASIAERNAQLQPSPSDPRLPR